MGAEATASERRRTGYADRSRHAPCKVTSDLRRRRAAKSPAAPNTATPATGSITVFGTSGVPVPGWLGTHPAKSGQVMLSLAKLATLTSRLPPVTTKWLVVTDAMGARTVPEIVS